MNLALDTRQRAMLQEMGVTAWFPAAAEPEAAEDSQVAIKNIAIKEENTPAGAENQALNAVPPKAAPQAQAQAVHPAPLPADLQGMDWVSLQQAAATCQACPLGSGRKKSVFGTLPQSVPPHGTPTDWLVVGDPPTERDEAQGEPFTGEAALLLANMLKAIGVDVTTQVVLIPATKCRTAGLSTGASELAQCESYVRRQVALTQPRMILAMGRYAAQALLAQTMAEQALPLGKLRGTVHRYQGIPVVVTYSPAALLRNAPDKAKAWQDLCLAKDALQASP